MRGVKTEQIYSTLEIKLVNYAVQSYARTLGNLFCVFTHHAAAILNANGEGETALKES